MIVLGIDTSGYANAVGVVDGRKILADVTYEAKTDSLEQIVLNIDSTLHSSGLDLQDVQGIGVGLGPGSWTGIRVGVTVGKMLAFSLGKPVCGVPTLEALAHSVRDESSLIYAIISAGTKDTVYAACYRTSGDTVTRNGEYYVGDVRGLLNLVTEPAVLVGDGVQAYRISLGVDKSETGVRTVEATPSGAAIALLTLRRLEQGQSDNVLSLTPLYLKESTAKAFVNRYTAKAKSGE
jgi:tRNA threonylcarbamoyladenosine biosynthesis protein TsaB